MTESGTVLITGPTRNLGRHAVLAMAGRPNGQRPDLLLVGRDGRDLTAVADEARARCPRPRDRLRSGEPGRRPCRRGHRA
jgi:short-subunit dehydrogenase